MANCLRCEKEIPDGMSFCENCKATINAGQNGQPAFAQQQPQAPTQEPKQPQQPYHQPQQQYQQPQFQHPQYHQQPQPYQQPYGYYQPIKKPDAPSGGLFALSFFFWQIGLCLYLVWKDEYPLKAKSCGKGALIGGCVLLGLSILLPILFAALGIATASSMYEDFEYYYAISNLFF